MSSSRCAQPSRKEKENSRREKKRRTQEEKRGKTGGKGSIVKKHLIEGKRSHPAQCKVA